MESNADDIIFLSSLFHDEGPATMKAHSANFVQYLGTPSCGYDPDRKPGQCSARVE